jgi:mono/diheme cytochrome c family protein
MIQRAFAWLGTIVLIGIAAWLGAPAAIRAYWWRQESNPIRRGAELAARSGCFSCHGPEGARGLPDPGISQSVPQWDGGVPMMYVNGAQEVREYIQDGVSKRRARSESAASERRKAAVLMPAYRDVLRNEEVDDLVAYVMAIAQLEPISDPDAAKGRDLVRRFRCEACHGISGSGGVLNHGSLKGYVPGWLGPDYPELVRSEEELQQWILEGGTERLNQARLARFFINRQRVKMPAYRTAMTEDDTRAIGAYIRLLRKEQ